MSNKSTAFIIGLTSFAVFTGGLAYTAVADQDRSNAKGQLLAQEQVNPNPRPAAEYPPAKQPVLPPPAPAGQTAPIAPVADNRTAQAQDTATIAPTPSQPTPQPPATSALSTAVSTDPGSQAPAPKKSKTTKTRAS